MRVLFEATIMESAPDTSNAIDDESEEVVPGNFRQIYLAYYILACKRTHSPNMPTTGFNEGVVKTAYSRLTDGAITTIAGVLATNQKPDQLQ